MQLVSSITAIMLLLFYILAQYSGSNEKISPKITFMDTLWVEKWIVEYLCIWLLLEHFISQIIASHSVL